jgi:hypothetical protein
MAKAKTTTHYRRADTGTYTTPQYAEKHAKTVVKETDHPKKASK